MLTTREVILAKIESTYGTDPTPTGSADAVLVGNLSWANEGLRMNERSVVRPTLSKLAPVYGGRLITLSFECEVKGSGTAGTAPEYGPLLRSCGFGETVVPVTSVTYAPASSSLESCTIYYYRDGKRFIVTGCRGNVAFSGEVGGIGKFTFTMTGHVGADADVALATPTYDSTVPVPLINGTFTIDSFAGVIGALNFDMSNTLSYPPDLSASDGYGEVQITGRSPTGSIDPEEELVATEDYIGNFASGTSMALATGTIGGTAGNIFAISMPAVVYTDASPGDREGIRTLEMPFAMTSTAGDNEISIAFT